MTKRLAFDWWQFLFYWGLAFCECQFRISPGPPAIICAAGRPFIIKIKIAGKPAMRGDNSMVTVNQLLIIDGPSAQI